jgi:hypothetical protein
MEVSLALVISHGSAQTTPRRPFRRQSVTKRRPTQRHPTRRPRQCRASTDVLRSAGGATRRASRNEPGMSSDSSSTPRGATIKSAGADGDAVLKSSVSQRTSVSFADGGSDERADPVSAPPTRRCFGAPARTSSTRRRPVCVSMIRALTLFAQTRPSAAFWRASAARSPLAKRRAWSCTRARAARVLEDLDDVVEYDGGAR